MTFSTQSNDQFNRVLRRQLQDLRIDPDSVSAAHKQLAPNRIGTWFAAHKEAVLSVGLGIAVLCIIFGVVLALAMTLDHTPTPTQTAQTSISSGGATLPVPAPAYRYVAPGQGSLTVHLNLHNPTDGQLQLRAGDLLLVDPHGAAFPPNWQSVDGTSRDGLADPNHVFVALDSNADVTIDLQFLVLNSGPFTLRYQRQGGTLDSQLPELTLGTATN